ncbi:MAG: thioredoxin-dependent thiol peroxidase [Oligoflexales bacterium]|nr:thioredoxin-dependent thiol peroxidase [Oligoflexales bacterium]
MSEKLLELGKKAPLFKLSNQDAKEVSLKQLLDTHEYVVIYFYPKAMTPGCTTQACGIRDYKTEFKKAKVAVVGLSPDPVPKLKKFVDKYTLNFDLLSDEDHKVTSSYGAWGKKKMMGVSFDGVHRVTFILDKKGMIRQVFKKVTTKTHHDDVLKAISELVVE